MISQSEEGKRWPLRALTSTKSQWLLLHQTMLLDLDENVVNTSKVAKFETHLHNVTSPAANCREAHKYFLLLTTWSRPEFLSPGVSPEAVTERIRVTLSMMGVTLQFSEYSVRYFARIKRGSVEQKQLQTYLKWRKMHQLVIRTRIWWNDFEHGSQFRYDKIDWLKFWLFDSNISIFGHWYVLQVFRGMVPVTRGPCLFTTRLQISL